MKTVFSIFITFLFLSFSSKAQLDSTRKHAFGLNISPALTYLSSFQSSDQPLLELRYSMRLKDKLYWRNTFGTKPNSHFNGFGYTNSTLTQINDSIIEAKNVNLSSIAVRASTGAEYRFLTKSRFALAAGLDLTYSYSETYSNISYDRYLKEGDVYKTLDFDSPLQRPIQDRNSTELRTIENHFGISPNFSAMYWFSSRFSARADVSIFAGLSNSKNREIDTGIIENGSTITLNTNPILGQVFLQFHL
jgi:hypothetical protein